MSRPASCDIAAAALVVAAAAFLPAAATGRAQGISAEEYVRLRPPAPREVRVTRTPDGAAVISWKTPLAAPGGGLAYRRDLKRYRVYRGPAGAERLIGETRARRFVDRSPSRGGAYYAVTAVHGEGQESGRTDPARSSD